MSLLAEPTRRFVNRKFLFQRGNSQFSLSALVESRRVRDLQTVVF